MLNDERLRWKHAIQPKVALAMIQLISGFMAFHSAISKTNMGIQDVIFSFSSRSIFDLKHSLDAKMSQECKGIDWRLNLWCLESSINLKNPRVYFRCEERWIIEEFGRNRRMRRFIAINVQDCTSFDE